MAANIFHMIGSFHVVHREIMNTIATISEQYPTLMHLYILVEEVNPLPAFVIVDMARYIQSLNKYLEKEVFGEDSIYENLKLHC